MRYLLSALSFVMSRLPKQVLHWMALSGAVFFFDILRIRRSLILKNIKIAFGDKLSPKERRHIGRQSVYSFILTFLEVLALPGGRLSQNIPVEGAEHLRAATAQNKGVYLLCLHMSNWEAMGTPITQITGGIEAVVKSIGRRSLDQWITESRRLNGYTSIVRQNKGEGIAAIKRALAAGKAYGFAADQSRPGSPKLPFFGRPAKTNVSLAGIWQKMPAPVVPCYLERRGVGKFTLHCLPEVKFTNKAGEAGIMENSRLMNQSCEEIISRLPSQYFWYHNRWKG